MDIIAYFGLGLLVVILVAIGYKNQKGGRFFSFLFGRKPSGVSFTVDLTEEARQGKIDPLIGREEEIRRIIQILCRRTKNNVALVGPAGVGKTAIAEGLALKVAMDDVPAQLKGKKVLSLMVADLIGGTKYRGEFEERIRRLVGDIGSSGGQTILFVDEMHTIMQARGTEGAIDFSDIVKPALARGELQMVGATTKKEFDKYIAPDESLERRFQPLMVDEPSVEDSISILQGLKDKYEEYHRVKYTDEAIEAAVRLSEEYIKNRRLPDKAIDLIDEAAAMVSVERESFPNYAAALLHGAAPRAVGAHGEMPDELKKLLEELDKTRRRLAADRDNEKLKREVIDKSKQVEIYEDRLKGRSVPEVGVNHVKEVVAEWADLRTEEIH
jgi:ATP-dependent Clp protease ATP-binding subunit ClpA